MKRHMTKEGRSMSVTSHGTQNCTCVCRANVKQISINEFGRDGTNFSPGILFSYDYLKNVRNMIDLLIFIGTGNMEIRFFPY